MQTFQAIQITPGGAALTLPVRQVLHLPEGAEVELPTIDQGSVEDLPLGEYQLYRVVRSERIGHFELQLCRILGVHVGCGGVMKLGWHSVEHQAIICPECLLHVPIEVTWVMTYGDLRKHAFDLSRSYQRHEAPIG